MNPRLHATNIRFGIACALAAVCAASALAANSRLFPFVKQTEPTSAATREVGKLDLDNDLFAATDGRYANMRLFDEDGVEIPFLLRPAAKAQTVVREQRVPMKRTAFEVFDDNRMEIVFEKNRDDPSPSVVVIATRLQNYEKKVSVWCSNDREGWEPLAVDRPVFDYSRYIDVRNDRVEIEPRDRPYYRIEISNITEDQQSPLSQIMRERRHGVSFGEVEKLSLMRQDFKVDEVSFIERRATVVQGERLEKEYPVEGMEVAQDGKNKSTVVSFRTSRQPLTALTILTSDANFSRPVVVEASDGSGDKSAWNRVASSRISRIDAGGFRQESLKIAFDGPHRFRGYRMTISNMDNPPIEVAGVKAEGEIREVVFFRKPGKAVRTLYGGDGIEAPTYDIGAVLDRMESVIADSYLLGPPADNPDYRRGRSIRLIEGKKLFVAAVILMVVVLALIIAKAVRKIEVHGQ